MRLAHYATTTILICLAGLLSGCSNGGSDSIENLTAEAPPPPKDGISGQLSSNIAGATITVKDATGREIVIATGRLSDSLGRFDLVFSEFEINAGIQTPLLISANAGGATATCDYDRVEDNDCVASDGSFVRFGATYTLPADYVLRGLVDVLPPAGSDGVRTAIVKISPASDLASTYASNAGILTEDTVRIATQQALGVVEFVTGLSVNGLSINEIDITDLTQVSETTSAALGLALYGSSLNGQISITSDATRSYRKVLDQMSTSILVNEAAPNNQLVSSGTFLSSVITPYLIAAQAHAANAASAVLAGAIASRTTLLPLLDQAADNPISISLPVNPASTDPLDNSKVFVTKLAEVMGGTLLATGQENFGGTASGAAIVYTDQLDTMATLVGKEVRSTIIQLDGALADALANGSTQLTGANVSGAVTFEGDTVTMETAVSTTSNIQTGISINITFPTGTRTTPGGTGLFTAADAVINVSQTQNDLTTQQSFTGALSMDMKADSTAADVEQLHFSGNITARSARAFSAETTLTSLAPLADAGVTPFASYSASYGFADGSTLSMGGTLQGQIDQYVANSNASTIAVDLQTNVITDMTVSLNVTRGSDGAVTGGDIRIADIVTATVDAAGVVFYSDGAIEVLPAPIR